MAEPGRQYEPVELLEFNRQLQAPAEPHHAGSDSLFADHADESETAGEEARSDAERAPYGNENLIVEPVDDAYRQLRGRKRVDTWLYMTAVAVVVAGILAILIFRPGGTVLPPADHRADNAGVAKTPPAAENSAPATPLTTSSVAAVQTDTDSGAQLASAPLLRPVDDPSSAPPMTEEDRSELFAALNRHADPQSAPVQEQTPATAAAVPKAGQSAAGVPPNGSLAATPSQQPGVKQKVAALLVKQGKNPGLSPAVTPACVAPAPSVIRDAVLRRIRGPASAQFGAATVLCGNKINEAPVRIICGSMSPRNAFGGYASWTSYLLIAELGFVEVPARAEDWSKYCTGPYKSSVAIPAGDLNASTDE